MAGATAFAFGSGLSHAYWAPIATIIAMKPVLGQTTIVAAQRLIGAAIGALAAILLMLIAASEHGLKLISIRHGLELIGLVLLVHAVAIRFWNYALYTAAIAAGVLVFTDLPNPVQLQCRGRPDPLDARRPGDRCARHAPRSTNREARGTPGQEPATSGASPSLSG